MNYLFNKNRYVSPYYYEVIKMSYVSPELRPKFETLSIELKDMILERNVELNTIHDLIRVLEEIVAESEG